MPLVENSQYNPPKYLRNGHVQTLIGSRLRRKVHVAYMRERVPTPDGDFIDIDWSPIASKKLAIIAHGIDGHSKRYYVLGMVQALNHAGYDVIALNGRGFSGMPNKKAHLHHAGFTQDLDTLIGYIEKNKSYNSITLVGFSMGGNIILKYLGECGSALSKKIVHAVAISVPIDLTTCAPLFQKKSNRFYFHHIQRGILKRLEKKKDQLEGLVSLEAIRKAQSWHEFDTHHTAPLFGFEGPEDYWAKASSLPYLEKICCKTLLLNALDDPILSEACYPRAIAEQSSYLFLETPKYGGHVGFIENADDGVYWSERRTISFLQDAKD